MPPTPQTRSAHRLTLRVPDADTSVLTWWNAQDDPSLSLRLLVRADIRRHGLSDTANRPVEQQIGAEEGPATALTNAAQVTVVPPGPDVSGAPASADSVRVFWDTFADQFTWDLLPFTFLHDLYQAWAALSAPSHSPLGRNHFIAALTAVTEGGGRWFRPRTPTGATVNMRVGDRMSAHEPLIERYRLTRWLEHGAGCGSVPGCCGRSNRRGLLRLGATGTHQDPRAALRMRRLEAELAELRACHSDC